VPQFKKGNKAAKGREIPEGQIAIRRLTKVQLETIIYKFLWLTKAQLESILKTPGETPMIELYVAAIMAKGSSGGDPTRLESLLARIHGKVPDKVEFEDKTDQNEIERLKAEYKAIMKKP
jgi:hypothetical protein